MLVRPSSTKSTFSRKNSAQGGSRGSQNGEGATSKNGRSPMKDCFSSANSAFSEDVDMIDHEGGFVQVVNSDFDMRKEYEDTILKIVDEYARQTVKNPDGSETFRT
jgi:hypothetical protein